MSEVHSIQTQQQAIGLLIHAAQIAQKRGTFNLEEAGLLSQAVSLLVPPAPPEDLQEESTTEEEATTEEET